MATPLTRIFLADIEASDLCPREHELGTCNSELTIMLVDADPLQPRAGAPFCFGYVRLKEDLAPLAYQHRLSFRQSLEGAPGRYGVLSFQVCSVAVVAGPPPVPEDADLPDLSHPLDWCGVLRFSPEIRDMPRGNCGLWSVEAAAGPPDDRGRLCPSFNFVSWHVQEEEGVGNHRMWMHWRHKQLFVVERDLLFSIRATSREVGWEGSCIQRLSKMRGPRGPCNMFTEAHPDPVLLKMPGTEVSVAMHLRFFPAEFLRPRSHAGGISIRITLLAAPPILQLPVVFSVPSGCFSLSGDNAKDTIFHISRIGDCTEVCLSDPLRIVGRSVWKVSETGREATTLDELRPDTDCLVDILALRLRAGDDKVITLPLGDHTIVLRLCLTVLHADIARPVLGVCVPALEPVEVLGGQGPGPSGHGQVVGIFVHALAVHSPQVTCCLLSGGPEAASAFYPLPHVGGKVFVPAQPDGRGKVNILAFLPEFGCLAAAQTAVGDGCLQLHCNSKKLLAINTWHLAAAQMQHRSSMVRRRCLASFCLVLFAAFSQSSFSFINLGLKMPGRIKALVARGAGEGAILSCDTREDFVANLNGSLTVAAELRSRVG
ncbi:hspD, partial [Symbiodinium sp. CCMP2456]